MFCIFLVWQPILLILPAVSVYAIQKALLLPDHAYIITNDPVDSMHVELSLDRLNSNFFRGFYELLHEKFTRMQAYFSLGAGYQMGSRETKKAGIRCKQVTDSARTVLPFEGKSALERKCSRKQWQARTAFGTFQWEVSGSPICECTLKGCDPGETYLLKATNPQWANYLAPRGKQ